mmetsp:Transcript_54494/g.145483  ORF Transcript_54494/g.145483 Transcript_54494/m.145483 type:complete len:134 (-) Transcript_54494:1-402(-)
MVGTVLGRAKPPPGISPAPAHILLTPSSEALVDIRSNLSTSSCQSCKWLANLIVGKRVGDVLLQLFACVDDSAAAEQGSCCAWWRVVHGFLLGTGATWFCIRWHDWSGDLVSVLGRSMLKSNALSGLARAGVA